MIIQAEIIDWFKIHNTCKIVSLRLLKRVGINLLKYLYHAVRRNQSSYIVCLFIILYIIDVFQSGLYG